MMLSSYIVETCLPGKPPLLSQRLFFPDSYSESQVVRAILSMFPDTLDPRTEIRIFRCEPIGACLGQHVQQKGPQLPKLPEMGAQWN